jgi:hypothetical protein
MALQTEIVCRYFTESYKTITNDAIITNGHIPSEFSMVINDG